MAQVIKIESKWYSDFTYQGKRIRRALSPFKEEAQLMLPDLIRSIRGARPGEVRNMSWSLFRMRYLQFSEANKDPNTVYKDRSAFDLVEAHSKIRLLSDMTPELLSDLKSEWEKAGETQSIVTRSVKAIKTAMRRAEDLKYIPLQNWRIVKVEEPGNRLVHYSISQLKRLLRVCSPPWKMATMLMGRGGLRSGEAFMLEWPDVQFERQRIRIWSRPGWRIKGDKKGNAEKYIPLEPDLLQFLKARRRSAGFLIDVAGYESKRMTKNRFLNRFKKYLKKAKLPGSPHALRHTTAAMMVSNGATLEEVAGVLGHKNLKTTQIYAHLSEEAKIRAINKLPRLSR